MRGHGQKLTGKQETLIAALLTESTYAEAAEVAGVSEATVHRWLLLPEFSSAYRQARRQLVEGAIGRIQGAAGKAVDALVEITEGGTKESDRVRAAVALLDHAFKGLKNADTLHGEGESGDPGPVDTDEILGILGARLRQLEAADLPTAEKSRLTAALADGLLRAHTTAVLDKRLNALQSVLVARKENRTP
jgi:hypothetical protein